MSLPYYKRYPRDFVEGTIGMSLELKGAYALILDMIYMQDGELPDDPRYISGMLGCSVRKWKSIRCDLINRGKLYVNGASIGNKRADKERESLSKFQHNQAEKGRVSSKNKNITEAAAKPARVKSEPEPVKELSKDSSKNDVQQAVDEWNELAREFHLPECRKITSTRKASIAARLREEGLEGWRQCLAKVRGSPFLRGEGGEWKANINFIASEAGFTKIMEGQYDRSSNQIKKTGIQPQTTTIAGYLARKRAGNQGGHVGVEGVDLSHHEGNAGGPVALIAVGED